MDGNDMEPDSILCQRCRDHPGWVPVATGELEDPNQRPWEDSVMTKDPCSFLPNETLGCKTHLTSSCLSFLTSGARPRSGVNPRSGTTPAWGVER